jgi:hypothetical protein
MLHGGFGFNRRDKDVKADEANDDRPTYRYEMERWRS